MDYVAGQLGHPKHISHKKMFGEYGVYYDDLMFALVCDDRLYIKATDGGREFIGDARYGTPYPNARPHFAIGEELEDSDWLRQLVAITVKELPARKKKPSNKRKCILSVIPTPPG